MNQNLDPNGPHPEKSRFTGLHTRTYEAELLISGAVVFGLFQVTPIVARSFDIMEARLAGHSRMVAVYGHTYLSLVLYALIGTFLLHLTMRTFWVGLVGLESVFPAGIRWDRLKVGPFLKAHARRKLGSLAKSTEHIDDLCSLVFSFGFLIVVAFLYSIILVGFATVLGSVVSLVAFGGRHSAIIFWTVLGLILGIQLVVGPLDRVLGPRFREGGAAGRVLSALIAAMWSVSPIRWIGQVQFTLQSNTSNSKVSAAIIIVMTLLGLGFVGSILVRAEIVRFDTSVHFPNTLREEGIDPRHYRSLRRTGAIEKLVPSVQSDIINGPYIKLSIPYSPRRYNPVIESTCPDLVELHSPGLVFGKAEPPDPEQARLTLQCIESIIAVALDGDTIENPGFDFSREKESGLEAFVTYIPTAAIEPGRHQLVVLTPSREMADAGSENGKPVRHVIPFWK